MPAAEGIETLTAPGGSLWRATIRLASVCLGAALLLVLLRQMDPAQVLRALADADGGRLALALALNLTVNTLARVCRRAVLLKPLPCDGHPVSLAEITSLFFAGHAANNLLPARAGDVLYAAQLSRRHGYRIEAVVVSQLVEKIAEILTLWLLAIPTAWLLRVSEPLAPALVGAVGLCLALVLVLVLWAHRRHPGARRSTGSRLDALVESTVAALRLLLRPSVWRPTLFWSFLSDAADVTMVGLCLQAVGIRLDIGAWCLILLAVNVSMCVPISAASLGVLEAGAVAVLAHLGVPGRAAMAFAILYHAVHVIPVTLIGIAEFRHLRWKRGTALRPSSP